MKRFFKIAIILAIACGGFIACGGDEPTGSGNKPGNGGTSKPTALSITPIEELNQGTPTINSHADVTSRSSIKMNYRSYVHLEKGSLGVDKPHYPRVKKMTDGNYIMFFHNNQIGASCSYAISENLRSWSAKGKVFTNYSIVDSKGNKNECRFSNSDALVLSNGDILVVASYRANEGYRELPRDAGIMMRRSTDNGARWGEQMPIYQGVNWEPYLLELPSGEIHCYFTDSNRTNIEGTDTGTAMVVSKDGGKTWLPGVGNEPYYVIRTKHYKDGNTYFNNQMPSVIKLNDSNELAAALEANIGSYHISFAYSGEDGKWDYLKVNEEGPADRHDSAFEGCAPYLVQFPSGETVLSYNKSSTYYLKMGDAKARNFTQKAYAPFKGSGFWGTLERIDNHQLIGAMPNTSAGSIMLARFVLNHRIAATRRSINIDGDNSEWTKTDEALFVGDKSQAQATLRCSADDTNVYFLIEVLDYSITKNDYAAVYISPVTDNDLLTDKACRIRVTSEGIKSSDIYNGNWTETELDVSVSASVLDKNDGYIAEIKIPRSKLDIKSGEVLVNFLLFDNHEEDAICDISSTSTAKWIPVTGL